MKFAKELDENAVPEWKSKYLDYKQAKKKLKAVARAIREVESRSPASTRRSEFGEPLSSLRDAPVKNLLRGPEDPNDHSSRGSEAPLAPTRTRSEASSQHRSLASTHSYPGDATPRAKPIPVHERSPLRTPRAGQNGPRMTRYGSIIGSPPNSVDGSGDGAELRPASTLELPMPSLNPEQPKSEQPRDIPQGDVRDDPDYDRPLSPTDETGLHESDPAPQPPATQMQHRGDAYNPAVKPTDGRRTTVFGTRFGSLRRQMPQRAASTPDGRPLVTRLFSFAGKPPQPPGQDIALEAYRELDFRKAQFFQFLDKELLKIETFYEEEESRAVERLKLLRIQLHKMRDLRLRDIKAAELKKQGRLSTVTNIGDKVGETSRSMAQLGTPSFPRVEPGQPGSTAQQDYSRHQPPYHVAKRQLKVAMQELYRGLELLKSYSLLNRTAFRKILKKYNKTTGDNGVDSRDRSDYMSKHVNSANFVSSDKPEKLIQDIEDLYSRYFERGNHKLAIGKLRAKASKASDYGGLMFRAGLMLGIGLVFGIQGIIYAAISYYGSANGSQHQTNTSYLLQLYGGYFTFLTLYALFILDAWVFELFHVNYPFIFELDNRNPVNWRRLSEIPSAFACLLGVCMWLNFTGVGGDVMYLFWPVVLIVIAVSLIFAPVPGFFHADERKWFALSLWRMNTAGLYSVEFRDFFLGDMFCSQTYAMGNIELFFCIYANDWRNPGQCNSTHSRLLGFFSTLPGIWRAGQCIRRYVDTRNKYPHLANLVKYGCTIAQYTTLSIWRIQEQSHGLKALFITAASLNSVYCIFWDIFNDWSLSPLHLRPILAYRKHRWMYYAAMLIDVVLRFLWVGYVVFPHDYQSQHSSLISFMIALLEVCRRGVWVIFRVENEHSTNVARYRATKQTELPYPDLLPPEEEATMDYGPIATVDGQPGVRPEATTTSSQLEGQPPSGTLSFRRRQQQGGVPESPVARALKRVGSTVLTAHAQDYERRRPTAVKEADSEDEEDSDRDDD